jgi:hypothetical protein
MKVKCLLSGIILATAVLLCGVFLAGCPTGGEDDASSETVAGADFTDLIPLPATGNSIPTTIAEQPQFTGTVAWKDSYNDGDTFLDNAGTVFYPNAIYRAAVTLTAKPGYSFKGTRENSFTHQKGATTNPAGTGSSLTVTVRFPKTAKVDDVLVSATNLTSVVSMPYRDGSPQAAVDHAEYSGTVSWETESGEAIDGNFAPGTVYRATIALTPKTGYTLSGLIGESFTYTGAQSVRFNITAGTVVILFGATARTDEDEKVTLFDLTDLISVPAHRVAPETSFNGEQYNGTVVWYYTEPADTPVGDAVFDYGKISKAVITLSANTGFTLTGLPANAFTHTGSTGTSNAAGSGAITITFPPAFWTPGTINYPSLTSGRTIKICCYPNSNSSGARLLANSTRTDGQNQTNNPWDYGWNGSAASNLSDWPDILKNAEGVDFTGDECGHGHPTVFLSPSMPESIRKRAHCFTLDLGSVTSDIVSFGIYPRTNESEAERGQRWPIQFEVFYSDTEIEAIPGDEATSLGVFEWGPVSYPWAWRDADLYRRTGDGKGFSARYIHVRIYAEAKNGLNSEWVTASFAGIRIGIGADS